MKKIALLAVLLLGASLAQGQSGARETQPPRIAVPSPPVDMRLAALEKRLNTLEAENAALKEELSHQKTSIKVLDMVLTEVKGNYVPMDAYQKHVHFISHFTFGGYDTGKIHGEDGIKSRLVLAGEHKPLWTGQPNQMNNAEAAPKP
jgi:hypothetical protein